MQFQRKYNLSNLIYLSGFCKGINIFINIIILLSNIF